MKTQLNKTDYNYREAVNYNGEKYYNAPSTVDIDGKKYILSSGTEDKVTIKEIGHKVVAVSQNDRLGYIGMDEFNTETGEEDGVFLYAEDTDPENPCISGGILEKEIEEQIEILYEYL